MYDSLSDRVAELKAKRNAVVLAHYYSRGDVQDCADVVGDSLALAIAASKTNAAVILFCGVHFMAETAALTCPEKTVLLPDANSGCPMSDMCDARELRKLKEHVPDAQVVCYVNSSAAVKAESDICCTSSNAVKVINTLDPRLPMIFVPDRWLGEWASLRAGRDNLFLANSSHIVERRAGKGAPVYLWSGYCPTHHYILPEFVEKVRQEHPKALLCVHPECRSDVSNNADFVGSTAQIIEFCTKSEAVEFIIGTEEGILHPLKKRNPNKIFIPITQLSLCQNMKLTTLEKMVWSLEDLSPVITVDGAIAKRARRPIDRMLSL